MRVLLVEDNQINQQLALRMLQKRGYKVAVANHGGEALEALTARPFDIVLMDIQMPVMGGFEALAAIRERERVSGGHLPIMAVTANAMTGDRERCLDAGFDAYVAKPIQSEELLEAMDLLLSKPHAARPSAAAMAAFDLEASLTRVEGDAELLREMAGLFLESYPDQLRQIESSVAAGDAKTLHRAAHSLKGSAANFNADGVVRTALELEMLGRNQQLAGAADALAKLKAALEALHRALAEWIRA